MATDQPDPSDLNRAAIEQTRLGNPEQAMACWQKALHIRPDYADAHNNLGVLLRELRRFDAAGQAFQNALRIEPTHADAHNNLGVLWQEMDRPQAAEAAYRQAIRHQPDHAEAWNNLGHLMEKRKCFEEAEVAYRQAIRIRPGYADARWNVCLLSLSLGRFQAGWSLYDARHHPDLHDRLTVPMTIPFPMWNGEPLAGKSLLLVSEHGFGDQIQLCRYTVLLRAQGVRWLTLVCAAPLAALFASLAGVDRVVVKEEGAEYPPHDFWTCYLSVPRHLSTTLATIPAAIPYLQVQPDRLARWEGVLSLPGLRVGLVWKGSPTHRNDAHRSLSSLALLAPLWGVAGVSFVSLQKGRGEEEAVDPPPGQPLLDPGDSIRDFADTAAILMHLDLVISIDSAVVHLAGALGRPCWVLLPDWGTDWRWLQDRTDSPWYPGCLRLFRQRQAGEWSSVVQRVAEELARLAQSS